VKTIKPQAGAWKEILAEHTGKPTEQVAKGHGKGLFLTSQEAQSTASR